MSYYIDLTLNINTYNEIIETLENHLEYLDSSMEIRDLVHLIDHLEEEKSEYDAKVNKKYFESMEQEKKVKEKLKNLDLQVESYEELVNQGVFSELDYLPNPCDFEDAAMRDKAQEIIDKAIHDFVYKYGNPLKIDLVW